MIQELRRDAQDSDTLPLWALQSISRHTPLRTELRELPVVDFDVEKLAPTVASERKLGGYRFLPALVLLFAIFNAADLISTFVGLHNGMHEGNPLMSMLLAMHGFAALILYKALVVAAVALGVRMLQAFRVSIANVTIIICNLLVLFVVIANVTQYLLKV